MSPHLARWAGGSRARSPPEGESGPRRARAATQGQPVRTGRGPPREQPDQHAVLVHRRAVRAHSALARASDTRRGRDGTARAARRRRCEAPRAARTAASRRELDPRRRAQTRSESTALKPHRVKATLPHLSKWPSAVMATGLPDSNRTFSARASGHAGPAGPERSPAGKRPSGRRSSSPPAGALLPGRTQQRRSDRAPPTDRVKVGRWRRLHAPRPELLPGPLPSRGRELDPHGLAGGEPPDEEEAAGRVVLEPLELRLPAGPRTGTLDHLEPDAHTATIAAPRTGGKGCRARAWRQTRHCPWQAEAALATSRPAAASARPAREPVGADSTHSLLIEESVRSKRSKLTPPGATYLWLAIWIRFPHVSSNTAVVTDSISSGSCVNRTPSARSRSYSGLTSSTANDV
jgi:hypothetical protein